MQHQANDLAIYDTHADAWWDGSVRWLRTLHNMVPARLAYFDRFIDDWSGKHVIDIGCGGGFMAEALAKRSAHVVGIDPSEGAVRAARIHAAAHNLSIDYATGQAEYLEFGDKSFDIVVCVDVLEHVESLEKTIQQIARILKPGGFFLFDTINRNVLAKFLVITAAERMIGLLPRGAHDGNLFIKPNELRTMFSTSGLKTVDLAGLGPVGVDRKLDIRFGKVPTTLVQYMGVAQKAF